MTSTRHQWGDKARFAHKTEQECARCATIKVTRHEWQAGRDVFWTEYWRDCEQIECAVTPPCEAAADIRIQGRLCPSQARVLGARAEG
jgi:hypothetical protein